jgi:hypothetical protein
MAMPLARHDGPGRVEADLSLFKTFQLREHLSLQARAEVCSRV